MWLKVLVVGPLQVNCYVVACEETKDAVVIDPGDDAPEILSLLEENELKLTRIINTHAHFDHLGAVQALKEVWGVKFYLHRDELSILDAYEAQLAFFGLRSGPKPEVDGFLEEGDEVSVGTVTLKVLHTPGHSPGSVSFAGDRVVFCGDLLFAGSIGRTDLPGGSYQTLIKSVQTKIFPLGDEVTVCSGHGPLTTVGRERMANPYLVHLSIC